MKSRPEPLATVTALVRFRKSVVEALVGYQPPLRERQQTIRHAIDMVQNWFEELKAKVPGK